MYAGAAYWSNPSSCLQAILESEKPRQSGSIAVGEFLDALASLDFTLVSERVSGQSFGF